MGNSQCGKEVDRASKKVTIPPMDRKLFKHIYDAKDDEGKRISTVDFISSRMELREHLEEWGYIWAHRLLEDVYIRPNFDVSSIINSFKDLILEKNEKESVEEEAEEVDKLLRLDDLKT